MSNVASNPKGNNGGRLYSYANKPVLIDCNFIVDSANGNGLGIRSLKGGGVQQAFMYTSAPTSPTSNPMGQVASKGYILIQLANNYNRYLGGFSGFVSPPIASLIAIDTTALTVGQAYTIAALGTSTAADWAAVGLPTGVTPALNAAFIATATGAGSGSGKVFAQSVSGISSIEVIGDANQTLAPIPVGGSPNVGGWILMQCLAPTVAVTSGTAGNAVTLNAGTTLEATGGGTVATTMAPTAPADNSVVGLSFYVDQSSALSPSIS